MKDKDIHYLIADIVNRSYNQSDFLLNLCDNDLIKYMQLEAKLKSHFNFFVPADKETVEYILNTEHKISDFKFNALDTSTKDIPKFIEIFLRK